MGKVFFPEKSIYIEASKPHPDNTRYKISIGCENWKGNFVKVVKVQMEYDGVVAGRTSPSYPNVDDYERVKNVLEELMKEL